MPDNELAYRKTSKGDKKREDKRESEDDVGRVLCEREGGNQVVQ